MDPFNRFTLVPQELKVQRALLNENAGRRAPIQRELRLLRRERSSGKQLITFGRIITSARRLPVRLVHLRRTTPVPPRLA